MKLPGRRVGRRWCWTSDLRFRTDQLSLLSFKVLMESVGPATGTADVQRDRIYQNRKNTGLFIQWCSPYSHHLLLFQCRISERKIRTLEVNQTASSEVQQPLNCANAYIEE